MLRLIKLAPTERLLIESGINHYHLVGPNLVWLLPWQRVRARLYLGPNIAAVDCHQARVIDDLPVNVAVKVIYRVNPDLFADDLLPRIPTLNDGGWRGIVQWRTEAIVRRLLARYRWRELKDQAIQEELEQQLNRGLNERLSAIGLEVMAITLVKTELDERLQQTIVRAEQDGIEAGGRAKVLKEYFEIFGSSLAQAMPYIIQWELLNTLHKKGNPQLLLAASNLSLGTAVPNGETPPSRYQLSLPVFQSSANGLENKN
ncbi:MAG: SPFH domain-containing protein [Chloroflexota bacterium]